MRNSFSSVRDGFTAVLFISVLLLCARGAAYAEWFADTGFDTVYDNNLSHALDKVDRKGDIAFVPHMVLGQYFQLTDSSGFSIMLDAGSRIYTKYEGMNNMSAGLTASLKYKHGLGAYAPWLKGYGSMKYVSCQESMRDGTLLSAGLLTGKRLYERLNIQVGYGYEAFNARNALFDQRDSAASVSADFSVTGSLHLLLGYTYRRGDVVMYGSPDPGEEEEVFLVNTFKTPMEVYQARATTQTVLIGLNKTLGNNMFAVLAADFNSIRAEGKNYPDTRIMAGIHYIY